jgi:hypothetical protein
VANLLLLLEEGPKGYSVMDLDQAFSDRDQSWENQEEHEERFRYAFFDIKNMLNQPDGSVIRASRLRNQADFYSLFGAVAALQAVKQLPPTEDAVKRLGEFIEVVESEERRATHPDAQKYYEAARSASNLSPYRKQRIDIMKQVLLGQFEASAVT